MALLLKSCLLHRTFRCATKLPISSITSNLSSFQQIRNPVQASSLFFQSQSFVQSQRFCTSLRLTQITGESNDQVLIYEGELTKKMRMVKMFSFATSAGGLLIQPYLIHQASQNNDVLGILAVSFIFLLFTVANPLCIHMLTKRYVTHLFYNEKKDEYTARTISFFLRQKEMTFQARDIKPLELTGMFTSCEVKGTSLFIDRQTFKDPTLYDKMMGFEFDKVFPVNLGETNAQHLNEDLHDTEKSSRNSRHVYKEKDN